MNQEHFQVVVPSNSSLDEFPNNTSNSFKVRFPQRIDLQGNHWEVGLIGATLPDTTDKIINRLGYGNLDLPDREKLADGALATADVFRIKAVTLTADGNWGSSEWARIKQSHMKTFTAPTGEAFMISVINRIHRSFTRQLNQAKKTLIHPTTKKRVVPSFSTKDVGDRVDIVLNNANLYVAKSKERSILSIRTDLAIKMGWLEKPSGKDYTLGSNLMPTDIDGTMTSDARVTKGFTSSSGGILLFRVRHHMMTLSPAVNWRFTNLNAAYDTLRGSPSRTLLIYSDVAASSMVGGQITDLLREVPYKRQEKGTMHIEPKHIHYQKVRSNVLETAEFQITEQNGNLVDFVSDRISSITLHFRNNV